MTVKHLLRRAARYYKTHIWLEIFSSVTLVTAVMLVVFYYYLQNQYYRRLMGEITNSDRVVITAAANSLDNVFDGQLRIGGELAMDGELFDMVNEIAGEGGLTLLRERRLRNALSAITHFSEDIAAVSLVGADGLIYEYGRYWDSNGTPKLWSGENLAILTDMYRSVRARLDQRGTGYYYVSADPARRLDPPEMRLYHIAYPLIGAQSSLARVSAAVVVTYRMENIVRTSAMAGGAEDHSDIYLTDAAGRILHHENPAWIGDAEADYLSGLDAVVLDQPLQYFGWRVAAAVDRASIRRDVNAMFLRSSLVYIGVIMLAVAGWALLLRRILRPAATVKDAMEAAERGEPRRIDVRGEHEIWSLAAEYNRMLDALDEQRQIVQREYMEKMRMEALRTEAERKALESQINAHFIFNTLNAIHYNAIEVGSEELARMIRRLSDIMRYTLSPASEVTLGREFDIALQYLELQKYRLMDKFEYAVAFPEEYSEWPCCKLFLQPFIENSIMHGFAGMDSGGHIAITGSEDGGRFRVEIADNGGGMSPGDRDAIRECFRRADALTPGQRGIGIRNVIARMKMFFGPFFEARLDSAPGEGTRFTFWLPIPGMSDDCEEDAL